MENNNTEYVLLIDKKNFGTIVRCNGRYQFEFDKEKGSWIRSGILLDYFTDSSPLYEMYIEISEEEAMRMIKN